MINRTVFGLATGLFAAALAGCAASHHGGEAPVSAGVMTQEAQRALTPDAVLADLKAGNERFVANRGIDRNWVGQARATASGQYPKAIVLGCLDSRVPPEVVFDQGIGDMFVGRVAGNFENQDMVGSMEFGTAVAGSKLIVVLGHTSCGAVMGAIDRAQLGNLTAMLANIEPAVASTSGERASSNKDFVRRVTEENVRRTVRDIQSRSEVISGLVSEGKLRVVGAVYELESGRVRWLDN
jgi:carbonic anhydrase